jgi:hypothetical protein
MLQQGLKIEWEHVTEYIPIDPANANESTSVSWTIERWPATRGDEKLTWVAYVTTSAIKRNSEGIELRLRYRSSDQTDERVKSEKYWGESVIRWCPADSVGEAYWIDDTIQAANGKAQVEVIYPDAGRARETVQRDARPEQNNLRKALLALDGKCALSGETQHEALQAAHIVPVSRGGVECPTNAILLRADLHILFDAKLLLLHAENGEAVVRCDRSVSQAYEAFNGIQLPNAVFQRIAGRLGSD